MSDEDKSPQPPAPFPRGAAGPPQPLPKGANLALLLISLLAIGASLATLAWVFGV